MSNAEITVCQFSELADPGSKEFQIGTGDWPLRGFVVRKGNAVYAYQNHCMHVGHPLNWRPDDFLTGDGSQIICASHGALYDIESGICTAGPCPGKLLRSMPVEIRSGRVVVKGPEIAKNEHG